jgi:hypothetical protein
VKIAGHIWAVVQNIIALFVILAIFNVAYSPFEKVVVIGLVIIYVDIGYFMATWGKTTLETVFGLAEEFERIRKMLPEEKDKSWKYEDDLLKEQKDNIANINIRYWINVSFMGLFSIIALFNLITTVMT